MSIDKIILDALDADQDIIHGPPERVLEVSVIGGIAELLIRPVARNCMDYMQAEARIEVPATSLLLALQTVIADSEAPLPERLRESMG